MKIEWRGLFCTILLYCFTEGRERFWPLNGRTREDDSLADILRKVLQASPARDVLLILRDSSSDGWADDILGEISMATARRVPTFYVNAEPKEKFQVSLSRDLLVYIYVSQREPDAVEGKLVVEDLKRFVNMYSRSKVLVLMILRQSNRDLAAFFQMIWSKRILNAIVVEHCRPDERSNESSTTVHRYNPFTDTLTWEPYSANTSEWFLDHFPDMQGYPLKYASFAQRLPYVDVYVTSTSTEENFKVELRGVDSKIIRTLADKMNFSDVIQMLTTNTYISTFPNGTIQGILPDMVNGKYDAVLNTLPAFYYEEFTDVEFTDSVHVEKWCFAVPSLSAHQSFVQFHRASIRVLFISFSIVGIFWLCGKLMRLDQRRWHPMRIIGIMLTSSYPPAPTRLHERIIFLSIFVTCARYSSSFFAELMSINLESQHYVSFDCLSDLLNSHLTLMLYSQMMDIVMQEDVVLEGKIRNVDKKVDTITDTHKCLETLVIHQNVSCFVEQGWANLVAVNNMRDGESMLRITKLCYLWTPTGYLFPRESPYIKRVSELLLMLTQGGLRDKWHRDYLQNETREMGKDNLDQNRKNFMFVGIFSPMLSMLKFGYILSILVFFGELIWKRFRS